MSTAVQCSTCGCANIAGAGVDVVQCFVCGDLVTVPADLLPSAPAPAVGWSCRACTFANAATATACAACGITVGAAAPGAGAPTAPHARATAVAAAAAAADIGVAAPLQRGARAAIASAAVPSVVGLDDDVGSPAAERAADAVLAAIAESGERFVDADFPAAPRSIGNVRLVAALEGAAPAAAPRRVRVPILWRRPSEVADENGEFADGGGGGGGWAWDPAPAELRRRVACGDVAPLVAAGGDAATLAALPPYTPRAAPRRPPAWSLCAPGGVQAPDVVQGGLGTCWLVSAMALVAERPALVTRLLRAAAGAQPAPGARHGERAASPLGAYQVRLCYHGEWHVVTIDDALPVSGLTGQAAFTAGRRRQLWPALLEKAAAKAAGSYAALASGSVGEGLRLLTGAPTDVLHVRTAETGAARDARRTAAAASGAAANGAGGGGGGFASWGWEDDPAAPQPPAVADALWAALCSFRDAGFLMGAAVHLPAAMMGAAAGGDGDGGGWARNAARAAALDAAAARAAEVASAGLVVDHAYSVVDLVEAVDELPTASGAPGGPSAAAAAPAAFTRHRLLCLRNPWAGGGGERGPVGDGGAAARPAVWRGAWSDGAPEWARVPALRSRLGVFAGLGADTGVFWIALRDFARFFGTVDVAKLYAPRGGETAAAAARSAGVTTVPVPPPRASTWHTARFRVRLPAPGAGACDVVRLRVTATTAVEVIVTALPVGASAAAAGDPTPLYVRDAEAYDRDIGFAVVRPAPAAGGAGGGVGERATGLVFVGGAARRVGASAASDAMLVVGSAGGAGGSSADFVIVPLSFGPTAGSPAIAIVEVHSARPVAAAVATDAGNDVRARVAVCYVMALGRQMRGGGGAPLGVWALDEPAGTLMAAVNAAPAHATLAVSLTVAAGHGGIIAHSRLPPGGLLLGSGAGGAGGDAFMTVDAIGARTAQLLGVVSRAAGGGGGAYSWSAEVESAAAGSGGRASAILHHLPGVPPGNVHAPFEFCS